MPGPYDNIFAPGGRQGRNPFSVQFGGDSRQFNSLPIIQNTQNSVVTNNNPKPGSIMEQYYQRMLDLAPTARQSALGDAGSILGSLGSDARDNRVIRGNAQQGYDATRADLESNRNRVGLDAHLGYDNARLLSNADRRDSESDAMQKIQLAAHLQRGDRSINRTTGARTYTPDASEQAAATTLSGQMMDRLNTPQVQPTKFVPDNSFTPTDPSTYANPGMTEKIGSYGGAALGGLSILDKLTGGKSSSAITGLLSKVPGLGRLAGGGSQLSGLYGASAPNIASQGVSSGGAAAGSGLMGTLGGKVLPAAGIALGTYGLMKNRGLGGNMMNGASAGAGIGTMVMPGLGTAIGAGIGAGAGALRGAFGVSEQEKQGRAASNEIRSALTASATPQQIAEAQASGAGGNALLHILLRDATGNDATASQFVSQLEAAAKQGPEAVAQVFAQLQSRRA